MGEEFMLVKAVGQYGILGAMLAFVVYVLYKLGSQIFTKYFEFVDKMQINNEKHTDATNTLVNATNKIANNVNDASVLLYKELEKIQLELKQIATADELQKNHEVVMKFLDKIQNQIQKILESKKDV